MGKLNIQMAFSHLRSLQVSKVGIGTSRGLGAPTMIQPIAMRGVVAKPYSSAPSNAAMATSRPVRS